MLQCQMVIARAGRLSVAGGCRTHNALRISKVIACAKIRQVTDYGKSDGVSRTSNFEMRTRSENPEWWRGSRIFYHTRPHHSTRPPAESHQAPPQSGYERRSDGTAFEPWLRVSSGGCATIWRDAAAVLKGYYRLYSVQAFTRGVVPDAYEKQHQMHAPWRELCASLVLTRRAATAKGLQRVVAVRVELLRRGRLLLWR